MKKDSTGHGTVPEYLRDVVGSVPGVLDEEPPWIIRKLVPVLYREVTIDDGSVTAIRQLASLGPVVYAMKFRNRYDLHFLRMRFADLGLPVPSYVFGMPDATAGSWRTTFQSWRNRLIQLFRRGHAREETDPDVLKQIIEKGGSPVLFLVDEKTSRNRYIHPETDPLKILLGIQGRVAGCVSVVPLFILYDRRPRRTIRPFWEAILGDSDRPGPLHRIVNVFRKWTVPELLVGEPVHLLDEFEEFGSEKTWEEAPTNARARLIASINDRIRVNRGPEKLSRTEIKEMVVRDPKVNSSVYELVASEGVSLETARARAEAFVDEIAADQRMSVIHVQYYFLTWLFSRLFEGIDLKDSQFTELKKQSAKGSLIFVPCHKSHLDYLLVPYLTFINNLALPLIAAGKNLSFWPVGPLFRATAAFFIRRSFKGLGLYARVFAAYLKVLVQEKNNIEFFLEGGRSRTGKLLPPKLGMLSYLIQVVQESEVEDLLFVPVFAGYDQVPEEKEYLRELGGAEKSKESLLAILRARNVLFKSYGKAYIRFHAPISFREFCKAWGNDDPSTLSTRDSRKLLNDFGYHLMHGIVRSGVVTPVDLAAGALVCTGEAVRSREALFEAVDYFSEFLESARIEFSDSLKNRNPAILAAIQNFGARGFVAAIEPEDPSEKSGYRINEQRRVNLQFYKNSLVNYLWPASMLSIVILGNGYVPTQITDSLREEFHRLKDLLSKELIVDPLIPEHQILEFTFELFEKQGWIDTSDVRTSSGMNTGPLECFRGILLDLLETYYLVLLAAQPMTPDSPVSQREFTKRMVQIHKNPETEEELQSPSLGSVTISNALLRYRELGILHYRPGKRTIAAMTSSEKLLDWKGFLRKGLR